MIEIGGTRKLLEELLASAQKIRRTSEDSEHHACEISCRKSRRVLHTIADPSPIFGRHRGLKNVTEKENCLVGHICNDMPTISGTSAVVGKLKQEPLLQHEP